MYVVFAMWLLVVEEVKKYLLKLTTCILAFCLLLKYEIKLFDLKDIEFELTERNTQIFSK